MLKCLQVHWTSLKQADCIFICLGGEKHHSDLLGAFRGRRSDPIPSPEEHLTLSQVVFHTVTDIVFFFIL